MSAPSTATAALHPHQTHYGYSHHQNYQPNGTGYRANNPLLTGTGRVGGSYSISASSGTHVAKGISPAHPSRPTEQTPNTIPKISSKTKAMPVTQPVAEQASKKRQRSREPDWHSFYKNGLPKEIIVIDDSPPPRISESAGPVPTPVTRNQTSRTVAGGTIRHAAKKRKTEDVSSAYNPIYHVEKTTSNANTPHYKDSISGSTISTDRTTSALHTTAATSLGSQYSGNGVANGFEAAEAQSGQKRKRVATRQQLANEAKKREAEANADAFSSYKPPPRPPIKAGDVHVKVVQDVRMGNLQY